MRARTKKRFPSAFLTLAAGVLFGQEGVAQEVRARVVDEASRSSVVGALVVLLATDSTEITRATTGPDGFFLLSAPTPGTYLVQAQHPGYATVTRSVVLDEGQSLVPAFVLPVTAIPLDTLEVEASRGGVTPQGVVGFSRPSHLLAGERLAVLDRGGVSFFSAVRGFGGGVHFKQVLLGERPFTCIESRRRVGAFSEDPKKCYAVAIIIDGIDTGIDDEQALRFFRSLYLWDWESVEYLSPVDAGTRYGLRASDRGALVLWSRGKGPHRSKARGGGG